MAQSSAYLFPYLRWQRTMVPQFPINNTAISADGSRCIAGTFQGDYSHTSPPPVNNQYSVYCWDRHGHALWIDQFMGYEGAFAVAISGDGSMAASGGWMQVGQGFARAYEADSGKQLVTYDFAHRVNCLAFSNDGSVLAIAENDAHLAQQSNGTFPANPVAVGLEGTIVEAIAMSDDGSVFVFGDYAGNVYLVENDDGSIGNIYHWAGGVNIGPVHSVAISADGAWFAAVGDSQSVYLFNLDSIKQGEYANSLNLGTSDRMRWVAISADGSFLSTVENVDSGGLVYGIQNDSGTLSQLWEQPAKTRGNPNCVSTDGLGKYVAVATGYPDGTPGEFCLFDGATGARLWHFEAPNMAWPCFISADGSGIIAGSDYGVACYFTPEASD